MLDFEEILPLILSIIIAIILFFGVVTALKKSFKAPSSEGIHNSRAEIKDQKRKIDEIRRRQKQLQRDQKQKIRDLQRR